MEIINVIQEALKIAKPKFKKISFYFSGFLLQPKSREKGVVLIFNDSINFLTPSSPSLLPKKKNVLNHFIVFF